MRIFKTTFARLTKVTALSFALSCSFSLLADEPIRLSEPVSTTQSTETFGAELDASAQVVSLNEIASTPGEFLGKAIKVQTAIAKVCQKKGCFFIAQTPQRIFRVSFKDYGFFIPTDAGGKTVWLSGELIEKTLSKEQADHFTSDLEPGNTATASPIEAGKTYEIIASSVQIPLA